MYTNNTATVTGTANDGNKFYEKVDGKIKNCSTTGGRRDEYI